MVFFRKILNLLRWFVVISISLISHGTNNHNISIKNYLKSFEFFRVVKLIIRHKFDNV